MARKLDGGDDPERRRKTVASESSHLHSDTDSLLDRRQYVSLSVAAVAGVAGMASGSAAATDSTVSETDHVLDAVEDLSMDPMGEESIASALRELPTDAIVEFPEGTYLLDDRVELVGYGTLAFLARGDVTIKGKGSDAGIHVTDATAVTYEGFTHDETDGVVDHRWHVTDELGIRNLDVDAGSEERGEQKATTASLDDDVELLSTEFESVETTPEEEHEYETIVLDPGEQRIHRLSDGERFENVLIDQTAHNAMFALAIEEGADDWVIRNVGWKGRAPVGGAREHTFLLHVRGNGLIENIFIDQRDPDGGDGSDVGAIWTYTQSHHGHIECRHNFIAGCGNNGCYDSDDGFAHRSSSGTVSHYRSYHRDNAPSNFRPGKSGSEIRECVSVANDPDGRRGGYPGNGSQLCRAIWAWHNPDIRAIDCAFWWDPDDVQPSTPFWTTHRSSTSEGSRCSLHLINCDINDSWEAVGNSLTFESGNARVEFENLGNDPTVSVLGEGVPLTPEMAAKGQRALPPELGTAPSGGVGNPNGEVANPSSWDYEDATAVYTDLPYELVIDHDKPGERVTYEVVFDGTVEAGEFRYNASVEDGIASGGVGPARGIDNVYFDGEIASITAENANHATFYLADAQTRELIEELDPTDFGIVPTDTGDDEDADIDSDDVAGNDQADSGASFIYEDVTGVHSDLPRELVIEHVEPGERTRYEVEIDGELEVGEVAFPPSIDGSVASGGVGPARGLDTIYFDGEITRFEGEHLDRVRVFIADPATREVLTEVDPETFPEDTNQYQYAFAHGTHTELPYELVIEHVEAGERATYEVVIDGECDVGEFDFNASLDDGLVTGAVGPARGLDNVYFDGEIESIDGTNLEHVRIYLADAQSRTILDELDPADFPVSEPEHGMIRIEGTGTPTNYEITVDGNLADDPDVEFNAIGNISGSNVEGTVIDDLHGYIYEGEIVDVRTDGDATIYQNEHPIDPVTDEPARLVRIDGTASNAVTRYRFGVSGRVEWSEADSTGVGSHWDELQAHVTDDAVTAVVHQRVDAYRFSGNVVHLDVRGPADVSFDRA